MFQLICFAEDGGFTHVEYSTEAVDGMARDMLTTVSGFESVEEILSYFDDPSKVGFDSDEGSAYLRDYRGSNTDWRIWEIPEIDNHKEFRVQTPAGPILVKEIPEPEYPGVVVMNEKEPGQPAVVFEFSPTACGDTRSCMEALVYPMEDPCDDPIIHIMGPDIRKDGSDEVGE